MKPYVTTTVLLLLISACGDVEIGGRAGTDKKELTQIQIPTPELPVKEPLPALPFRIFSGVVDEDITIQEGEVVAFSGENPPTFLRPLKILAGATLHGGATFKGKLNIHGRSDNAVLWTTEPGQVVTLVETDIEWLIFRGTLHVLAKDKTLSVIENSTFRNTTLLFSTESGGRLDLRYLAIENSAAEISYKNQRIALQVQLVSCDFLGSDLKFKVLDESVGGSLANPIGINGSNFRDSARKSHLILLKKDLTIYSDYYYSDMLRNNNYFSGSEFGYYYRHISSPFWAGPGARTSLEPVAVDGRAIPTLNTSRQSFSMRVNPQSIIWQGNQIDLKGSEIYAETLNSQLNAKFRDSIRSYSYDTNVINLLSINLDFTPGNGCELISNYLWSCQPNFSLNFKTEITYDDSSGKKVVQPQEFTQTFLSTEFDKIKLDIDLVTTKLLQLITNQSLVDSIPVGTPYF